MKSFYRHLFFLVFALALAFAHSSPSDAQRKPNVFRPVQSSPNSLEIVDVGKVEEVIKPDLIRLDNGRRYLLDNVRISPYFSHDVIDYLNKNIVGKNVGIFANTAKKEGNKDRYGNLTGHIQTEEGLWVQADMIEKGLAWAHSSETGRDLVLPLYKKEIAARTNKAGMWAEPSFVVRNEFNIHPDINTFQIYEGVVKRVSIMTEDVFFYFGEDPKTDFTLRIPKKSFELFRMDTRQVNFLKFKGMLIRARGWIYEKNGPMMDFTHPEQIEFADFDKYNRAMALKSSNPPPLMPYDLEEPKDEE